MTRGTLVVDFAGTVEEARAFIAAEGHRFANPVTLGRGTGEMSPNGDPQLFVRYLTKQERGDSYAVLADLGWDFYSVEDRRWGTKK